MDKRNKPFTVIIEGNIGSGKTTLLNYFSKYRDVEVLQEPVERWRNVEGHNLLVTFEWKYCEFFHVA
jgi:deoxyadenosine/deoxycytidine kinase